MRNDRHGRGSREIYSGASFEADLMDAVEQVRAEWESSLRGVNFLIEEIPSVEQAEIPLGTVKGQRVIIYRRPIELRSQSPAETRQLIFDTVVEQVAELLGIDPCDVHDDYGSEE